MLNAKKITVVNQGGLEKPKQKIFGDILNALIAISEDMREADREELAW